MFYQQEEVSDIWNIELFISYSGSIIIFFFALVFVVDVVSFVSVHFIGGQSSIDRTVMLFLMICVILNNM